MVKTEPLEGKQDVLFQGGTIKFLVNLLDIDKKKEEQKLISDEVNDTVIEHIMAGIDVISGKLGKQYLTVSSTEKLLCS